MARDVVVAFWRGPASDFSIRSFIYNLELTSFLSQNKMGVSEIRVPCKDRLSFNFFLCSLCCRAARPRDRVKFGSFGCLMKVGMTCVCVCVCFLAQGF